MTKKEMANIIKEEWAGVAEQQIESGRFLHKVGRSYVYVLDIHGSTSIEKWPIDVFFAHYVEKVQDDRDLDYSIEHEVVYNFSGKC